MKKRFGVSLSEGTTQDLNAVASKLGCNRSAIVEKAVELYLTELKHASEEHTCLGVMIITKKSSNVPIENVYEEFKDVISGYTHYHVRNTCVDVVLTAGSSSRILELRKNLEGCGCLVKYVILH
ncbi:MAG: hypothetical protein B7O98_00580 [Zestosphaera tikiterensis]|uniref:Predicted DNA-binding protein ribbon-helix-helix domain-containing protein n=1 Tax=Zestosphaera tikiterensis TaxID=1973259 RepID=A0A2R7Y9F2_9CREN|nr:MAG: hypothetical protein B7O98_00580 [Zestosphaera tikiterensis]